MPEIAFAAAWERLDMLLNDAMYGILFRDINMKRTLCDQHFSRRICALADIVINTGEDNYITTADADEAAHTVIASQFVNESFAHRAGLPDRLLGLGHSFEIDPAREDTIARELAQALLVRTLFPEAPIKYMPPTKHKQGDIFFSHGYDLMADVVGWVTGQGIQLLGMMTEAMHNPFLMDRYRRSRGPTTSTGPGGRWGPSCSSSPGGMVESRAAATLHRARQLLEEVAADGLFAAIGKARFGDVARRETGGKGLDGRGGARPRLLQPAPRRDGGGMTRPAPWPRGAGAAGHRRLRRARLAAACPSRARPSAPAGASTRWGPSPSRRRRLGGQRRRPAG